MNEFLKDTYYVGVNDHEIDLFEGMYKVPSGMSYNSYVIKDEKIAVMDSVDADFGEEWLKNISETLGDRSPDYIIVLHMEPDHSANIARLAEKYNKATVVGNMKTFVMLKEFFGTDYEERRLVVKDGDKLPLGKHELTFVFAPMVHWPEVMTAYDSYTGALYSADAFGKFGALDCDEPWEDEARRYYIGIVGKYGMQVQSLLKKLSDFAINAVCPLHGPLLTENLGKYIELYRKWSAYEPEKKGVLVAYTSVYGHTRAAALRLAEELKARGVEVEALDIAREDRAFCVAEAFRYSALVLATTTYNGDIFPAMREYIDCLVERNFQSRKVAFVENGSWAPYAAKAMAAKMEKCKNLVYLRQVRIRSSLNEESLAEIKVLADELTD